MWKAVLAIYFRNISALENGVTYGGGGGGPDFSHSVVIRQIKTILNVEKCLFLSLSPRPVSKYHINPFKRGMTEMTEMGPRQSDERMKNGGQRMKERERLRMMTI